jgi:hypothetical protein
MDRARRERLSVDGTNAQQSGGFAPVHHRGEHPVGTLPTVPRTPPLASRPAVRKSVIVPLRLPLS